MPQFRAAIAALGLNVNNLLGVNHKTFELTEQQYDLFKKVYIKHLQSLKTAERKRLAIQHIDSIIWNTEGEYLKVLFDNGECWHYEKNLSWHQGRA